jgi:hypothetical protein
MSSIIPVSVPTHWIDKFDLTNTDVTFELLEAINEYGSDGSAHCRVDVVVKSDTIFAFRIAFVYTVSGEGFKAKPIYTLLVSYITSDYRVCESRISSFTPFTSDWEVAKEVARYLGLSEAEWKEEGRIKKKMSKLSK